jgi:hypothetical protein
MRPAGPMRRHVRSRRPPGGRRANTVQRDRSWGARTGASGEVISATHGHRASQPAPTPRSCPLSRRNVSSQLPFHRAPQRSSSDRPGSHRTAPNTSRDGQVPAVPPAAAPGDSGGPAPPSRDGPATGPGRRPHRAGAGRPTEPEFPEFFEAVIVGLRPGQGFGELERQVASTPKPPKAP